MNQQTGICQPPGADVSPSLADVAPELFQRYFDANPNTFLSRHHIESYEAFIFRELPELILAENPITILKEPLEAEKGIYKYKTEIFVGGVADVPENLVLDVGAPVITLDAGTTVRRMFPNEARIRNLTYSTTFRTDILIRLTFTNPSVGENGVVYTKQVRELKFEKFNLFRIPILLRSKLCATYNAPKSLLMEMGECRNDAGGYFIIDGAEKLLITRQEQAFNSIYISVKPPTDEKIATYASVICQHPVTKQTRRVGIYRLHASRGNEEGVIRISIPFVKGAIPLFALFRALGVESDKEIVRMILPDTNSPATTSMENTLIASIQDAYPITSQIQAIEFIRTLTKGFIVENVLDILHTHLFSHVPDKPLARAQYLAEFIRRMIRVEMRMEPNTNRDDIRNQRLLSTGTLLRGLFSECLKDWKKAVRLQVDVTYNYNKSLYTDENFLNIFSPGNIAKILASAALNDSIMRGFRGKWGTNQYNMKSGVIQPLARISYMDAMSHIRRVVSDFDTSMKLVGPRHLNPSQIGYFCTSETPTGSHIGATKNLSILTAISISSPATQLMNWLLTRGGVIDVAKATQAVVVTAASVQINGGTIGFSTDPGLLTRVLKQMKWTACLPPTASVSFNTADNSVRVYLDDGRPLRPLWHLGQGGTWPPAATKVPRPSWRDLVCGTLPLTAALGIYSTNFVDPLVTPEGQPDPDEPITLADYDKMLAPHIGAIEYIDPYEGNEAYVSWYGNKADLTPQHTHAEIHPSSMMGLLTNMIPFANHNQSPRNQLSCSQSKQAIGYYATNYENRFDTYGSMLCYGEGALARTIVHEAVGGGAMPYGSNIIFCINSFNGYNQDDGILFNRTSIERGLFRSLALRSYTATEEVDPMSKAVYRIGNPRTVLAWTDLKPGYDYSALDDTGIIKEGARIHDKLVLVGMYLTSPDTGAVTDASVLPTVFTNGRVDKVVVLHQANGMRLVHVRILEERVPELGDKFCLTPDHEVLTANRGWVGIADVETTDNVCCLNPADNTIHYTQPTNKVTFDCVNEPIYHLDTQQVQLMTTMNHKMWVQTRDSNQYELLEAKGIHGKRVRYMKDGINANPEYVFSLPAVGIMTEKLLPMSEWLEFLGLWISDGWVSQGKPRRGRTEGEIRIEICAVVESHRQQVINISAKLGLHTTSNKEHTKLYISDKQLAVYLKDLSVGAIHKRLPEWIWKISQPQARVLLEGLVCGDGYRSSRGVISYYTSSKGLCDDVQRLCLHAGYSANVSIRNKAGDTFTIRGKVVKTNADAWFVHIIRCKNRPMVNHGHTKTQNRQRETIIPYTGKVHCIEVPDHVFYVRRNGIPVWTGNSSRHGQKGTMGMLLDAQDMPRTAEGLVPDVMVNPHCIPSRMTIAQLLEQVFGKLGAVVGAKMNATSFMNDEQSFKAIGDALEAIGLQREGEEILYSGITGKMFTSSVFMGPLYFMRLKHLTQDKLNSRAKGRKEIRTHQPTGGRGNEGGMRIGEMERDALIAHGVTEFLQESMMKRSDGTTFWICNGCGTMPIYNEAQKLFVCPTCDGPLTFQGETADTLGLVLPVKKSRTTFSQIEIPYALKLLDQELTTYANASVRFLTEKHVRAFRDLPSGTGVFESTPTPPPADLLSSVMATFAGTATATATATAKPAEESPVSTPTSTPVATATPAGGPLSKEEAAANAMFDFMPGGPPKLEVVEEEPTPTPTPTPENTNATTDVKVVKVSDPTPNMAGPAEPVPTVISEATDNPLIAEGAPLTEEAPNVNDAVSVQAVKGEPTVEALPAAPRPRRSSMKGGRVADAQIPSTEIPSEADVKVIKIDA